MKSVLFIIALLNFHFSFCQIVVTDTATLVQTDSSIKNRKAKFFGKKGDIVGVQLINVGFNADGEAYGPGIFYEHFSDKNKNLSFYFPIYYQIPEFQSKTSGLSIAPMLKFYPFGIKRICYSVGSGVRLSYFRWHDGASTYSNGKLILSSNIARELDIGFEMQSSLNINLKKCYTGISFTSGFQVYPYLSIIDLLTFNLGIRL